MRKIFIALLFFFACNTLIAQLLVKQVSPISANNLINSFTDVNVVMYDKDVPSRDKLVIMLANTGDIPADFSRFDSVAARAGFHVLGISYNNSPSVLDVCKNKTDPYCYENVRRQVVTGDAYSPDMQVDSNHNIISRVRDMIKYLDTAAPAENWGQYLSSDNKIQWQNVIVAGHGEGASYAAFIGKLYKLSRVLSFAPLPEKMNFNQQLASWVTMDGKTPEYNFYLFYQERDTNTIDTNFFSGIGYSNYGKRTFIEDASYPFHLSRELCTRFISSKDHTVTIKDSDTPTEPNGKPRFMPVWNYMLTNESFQSIQDLRNDFMVYPNPFKEEVVLKVNSTLETHKWEIFTLYGTKVLSGVGSTINTATLNPGQYFIRVSAGNGHKTMKVIKE